jgi:alkanesulfonate monooxygenase SsuD/methylene tetrahydromethanopterin reductase-like flavin-dependent oxidoreductase (luciferase family)
MMLAIIGGPAARFRPFATLYREELDRLGLPQRPIGVHSPGHIAQTDEQAREEFWPHYLEVFGRVSRERGFRPPDRATFEREVGPHGALYVGSPETVARKIADTMKTLGATRFDLKYAMGGLAHERLMGNIELYGVRVAPLVRNLLAESDPR